MRSEHRDDLEEFGDSTTRINRGGHPPSVVTRHGIHSDVGRRRRHNEDVCGASFPVFVVADGMGGHEAGEVAAAIAVEELLSAAPGGTFASAGDITEAIARAAQRVFELADSRSHGAPGTTLAALAFSTHRGLPCVRVFNIGDSRTYLLSGAEFAQVTTDHSEVQELLDAGSVTEVEARALPRRNIITRSLGGGSGPYVAADQYVIPAEAGDRYVVCSDGLSGEVTDALIEMVCRAIPNPQAAADELVKMALTAGGKDNVTVLIVDVVEASPKWAKKTERGAALGDSPDDDTVPAGRSKSSGEEEVTS